MARRADRLESLQDEIGAVAFAADLTRVEDVTALAAFLSATGPTDALAHIAGGALGSDTVERGSAEQWRAMFEMNVLAAQRMVAALLPLLRGAARQSGHADALFVTSTAAQDAYPGGGGYNAAKAGESMLVGALRQELNGEPIRVMEVAPGLVHTEEFSLNRFGGDRAAADRVYQDVPEPLTAEDVADVIGYALNAPGHVNLDLVTMRPVAQSATQLLARGPLRVRED